MKREAKFLAEYRKLNPQQRQAVDHIEAGPLLLLAGPGTGKTQVLAMRIANILYKTDAKAENILALTFTDAAAKNMRERLLNLIGKDAYYVHIETFHAFCRQVIADFPEYFPLSAESTHLSDLEKFDLIEKLLDKHKPQRLRPLNIPYLYVRDLIRAISDLKRESIDVLAFEEIVSAEADQLEELRTESKAQGKIRDAQKEFEKHQELLLLYKEYQNYLEQEKRFDYDDMINFVVSAFRQHEDLLREYQENLHYFLVDEFQDTNSAQNALLNLLAAYWEEQGSVADLFVVGDPNQAIYRFQGASVENVLSFTRQYPDARVLNLEQSYRCPQIYYDIAGELISYNHLSASDFGKNFSFQIHLQSTNQKPASIQYFVAGNQILEAISISEKIRELLAAGVAAREIAVLYRNNSDVEVLRQTLAKWQIAYQLAKGDNVLEVEEIQQLLSLFRVIDQIDRGESPDELYDILHFPWLAFPSFLTLKLLRVANQRKLTLYQCLLLSQRELEKAFTAAGQTLEAEEWQKIQELWEKIQLFIQKNHTESLSQWFEEVISPDGFGFLSALQIQTNHFQLINQLNTLYDELKNLLKQNHQLKLSEFLETLAVYQEQKLSIQAENLNKSEESIFLSTVHSAKGMEWKHVFILGFVDKKWGNQRERNKLKLPNGILKNTDLSIKEKNEDERRLFYVALTRAKEQLYISYPEKIQQATLSDERFPSIFFAELQEIEEKLGKKILQRLDLTKIEEQADQFLVKLLSPAPKAIFTQEKERAFLQDLVKDFALSVTALNNYLRDPHTFLENNLLRVPRAKPIPMAFGTAVHKALELYWRSFQQTAKNPGEDFLLTQFKTELNREILTESDFADRLHYGQKVLRNYYQQVLEKSSPQIFALEKSYGSGRKILLGDIPLAGKIDRIDWLDRERRLVRVIDYKTGHNRSVNEIEAATKSSQKDFSERELALPASIRGPYKRQLIFYKLLLDLDRSLNPSLEVAEAVFDFVEPLDKEQSKVQPRVFQITQEEVEELKQLIKTVMAEIRSLAFLDPVEDERKTV
jgi:DNA helicase-2/ATP-dependent DNA helicase PcrA